MIYVYAPSMATVTFVLKRYSLKDIFILSPNDAIVEFCKRMEMHHMALNTNRDKTLKGLKAYAKYIRQIAKTYRNVEFLFCFYGFDYWGLYFIKKLSKENFISFYNLDNSFKKIKLLWYKPIRFQDLKDKTALFLATGICYERFEISSDRMFWGLSPSRLESMYSLNDENEEPLLYRDNRKFIFDKYTLNLAKAIFIDQGNTRYETFNDIIEVLKESYSKDELIVKPHPNFDLSNKNFRYFHIVNREIPVEVLLEEVDTIIGIASTGMRECRDKKIISIINLVSWVDEKEKQKYLSVLDDKTLIPNNLEEFKDCLI